MPPRSYYESLYNSDPHNREYQSWQSYSKWVRAFYSGWGGIQGWRYIREEILEDVAVSRRAKFRAGLNELGGRISGEWAKSKRWRAIDSRTVQVWVDAAYKAGEYHDHERLLEEVSADVDALLSGELDPVAITLQRYYPNAAKPASLNEIIADPEP